MTILLAKNRININDLFRRIDQRQKAFADATDRGHGGIAISKSDKFAHHYRNSGNLNYVSVDAIDKKYQAKSYQGIQLADNEIPFIITRLNIDRDGDIVVPMGLELEEYKSNPVVFLGHQEWIIPIASAADEKGRLRVWREKELARSIARFDTDDPDADYVLGKYKRGYMHAVSVAFLPIEASRREDFEKAHYGDDHPVGFLFRRACLTEYSCVGIPANAGALRDSLDQEKSFMSPRLRTAMAPFAARAKGRCFSGWCPYKRVIKSPNPPSDFNQDEREAFRLGQEAARDSKNDVPPKDHGMEYAGAWLEGYRTIKLTTSWRNLGGQKMLTKAKPSDEISPSDACAILDKRTVDGKPLTDDQRRMFGAACSRSKNVKKNAIDDGRGKTTVNGFTIWWKKPSVTAYSGKPVGGGYSATRFDERSNQSYGRHGFSTRQEAEAWARGETGYKSIKSVLKDTNLKANDRVEIISGEGAGRRGTIVAVWGNNQYSVIAGGNLFNRLSGDVLRKVRRNPGEKSVRKYITHSGDKWIVHAESGKVLGTHDTKADAENQLRAVEANKHKGLYSASRIDPTGHLSVDLSGKDTNLKAKILSLFKSGEEISEQAVFARSPEIREEFQSRNTGWINHLIYEMWNKGVITGKRDDNGFGPRRFYKKSLQHKGNIVQTFKHKCKCAQLRSGGQCQKCKSVKKGYATEEEAVRIAQERANSNKCNYYVHMVHGSYSSSFQVSDRKPNLPNKWITTVRPQKPESKALTEANAVQGGYLAADGHMLEDTAVTTDDNGPTVAGAQVGDRVNTPKGMGEIVEVSPGGGDYQVMLEDGMNTLITAREDECEVIKKYRAIKWKKDNKFYVVAVAKASWRGLKNGVPVINSASTAEAAASYIEDKLGVHTLYWHWNSSLDKAEATYNGNHYEIRRTDAGKSFKNIKVSGPYNTRLAACREALNKNLDYPDTVEKAPNDISIGDRVSYDGKLGVVIDTTPAMERALVKFDDGTQTNARYESLKKVKSN